jgi:hypothetical protein
MTQEANKRIEIVLSKILDGYCLSKKYNYCLEYSVAGLLKDSGINESELGLILSQLEEKEIISNFSESGNDNVIAEDTYTIYFPDNFVVKATSYIEKISGKHVPILANDLLEPQKPELTLSKLVSYNDGLISYDGKPIEMRSQTKVLCRMFMENVGRLILVDDIKDTLIDADKRKSTSNETIAKYVSELHTILKDCYGKKVIFNQKKEGWIFNPESTEDSDF